MSLGWIHESAVDWQSDCEFFRAKDQEVAVSALQQTERNIENAERLVSEIFTDLRENCRDSHWEHQWAMYERTRKRLVEAFGYLPSMENVREIQRRLERRNQSTARGQLEGQSRPRFHHLLSTIQKLGPLLRRQQNIHQQQFRSAFPRPVARNIDLFAVTDQQRRLIHRNAPLVCVHGTAGTGKSVVLAHRALLLAARTPTLNVLLLSPTRALANELRELIKQYYGQTHPRVRVYDFNDLVDAASPSTLRLWDARSGETGENSFEDFAFSHIRDKRTPDVLAALEVVRRTTNEAALEYLRDEFAFIDGECWIDFDSPAQPSKLLTYSDTPRTGRGFQLTHKSKRVISSAYGWWEEWRDVGKIGGLALRLRQVVNSWGDTASSLGEVVRRDSVSDVGHIIVDEYQRLPSIGVVMLRTLIEALPHNISLTLGGDPEQAGMRRSRSMKALGIDLTGRTRYLRQPLRTTYEIERLCRFIREEARILGAPRQDDADNKPEQESEHRGVELPALFVGDSAKSLASWLVEWSLQRLTGSATAAAIFMDRRLLTICKDVCLRRGLNQIELTTDDEPGSREPVRPGIVYLAPSAVSAQGLEFDYVACVDASADTVPPAHVPDAERWRSHEDLYNAIARARSEVAILAFNKPCRALETAAAKNLLTRSREPATFVD